jgi:signal transduction histidine kinase/CheY-like chemotaxis protein
MKRAKKNILIIDDEKLTREQLKYGLENEFNIFEASGWKEAKRHIDYDINFELILIDQVLQKTFEKERLDGIGITRKILKQKKDANIIVYTLKPDKAFYDKVFDAGARKYIVKKPREIQNLVRQLSRDSSYFFALSDTLTKERTTEILKILPQYLKNLGAGISIIDKSYGLWYRNEAHIKMLKGFCKNKKLRSGVTCWVEYLGEFDQKEPCYNCPAAVVFERGQSYRTPVPMRIENKNAGLVKYLDITSNPIKNNKGEVIGAIQTVIDVTERENLIALGEKMETAGILEERIELVLKTINSLGYDRIRYYLLSADKSEENRAMVLKKVVGHKEDEMPEIGSRLKVKRDKYWENTLQNFRTKKAFIYGDNKWNKNATYLGPDIHQKELYKEGVKEWVEFPLVAHDHNEVLGTICIDNKYHQTNGKFLKSDIDKLEGYINAAANSIYNLKRYESTFTLARASEELAKIDTCIMNGADLVEILQKILESCIKYSGATSGHIRLPKRNYLEIVCEEKGKIREIIPMVRIDLYEKYRTAKVFHDKQKSVVFNAHNDSEFQEVRKLAAQKDTKLKDEIEKIKSYGIFPLKYTIGSEEPIAGVMTICSDDLDFFANDKIALVEYFGQKAASASLAYEHKKITSQIEKSDKMASLGRLIAGISHETRNPITVIDRRINQLSTDIRNLKTLLDIRKIRRQIPQLLQDINSEIEDTLKSTSRLKKIVDSLYLFSHPGKEKFEMANLHKIIESSIELVWNEIKYKAEVTKDFDKSIQKIECNPQKLQQVFLNILINAVEAIENHGLIRIKTRKVGKTVVVEFANTGQEIPKEIRDNIFDPFFTTKEVGKGTGLGLSIVFDFIKQHHGIIDVSSGKKETVFTITLPIRKNKKEGAR